MACVQACSTWGECGHIVYNSIVVEKKDLKDFCKCPNFVAQLTANTSSRGGSNKGVPGHSDDDNRQCAAGGNARSNGQCGQ